MIVSLFDIKQWFSSKHIKMPESIVATIEYDKDQDDVQKVIDLDPDMPWNDFKMIVCRM